MKAAINLASRPYENLRPLYSAVTAALLLAIALGFGTVWKARRTSSVSRLLSQRNEQYAQDLSNLRREQAELTRWIERPEIDDIRDRSAFLNALIVRKSLSWTQLFMDLEKVLPDRVQVTAIRPSPNESAQAQLNLTVASPNVASVVEFLKNLEESPQFSRPLVDSQRFPAEKAADPNILFEMSVLYRHSDEAAPSRPAEPDAKPAAEPQPGAPGKVAQETSVRPAASLAAAAGKQAGGER